MSISCVSFDQMLQVVRPQYQFRGDCVRFEAHLLIFRLHLGDHFLELIPIKCVLS